MPTFDLIISHAFTAISKSHKRCNKYLRVLGTGGWGAIVADFVVGTVVEFEPKSFYYIFFQI